jgi:negative regulator of flagellin synthesis FlgM
MKIHNHVTPSSVQATDKSAAKSDASAIRSASTGSPADSVSISDASRALSSTGTSSTEAPFDAKRVDEIKAAISAGSFKVNPEAIAGKIIDSATQLLSHES